MTTHHESVGRAGELFARWPVTFDPPTRRTVNPPQPVIVSVAVALAGSSNSSFRDGTPLRVRAEGLSVDVKCQGELFGWARLANGAWIACVTFSVPTGNGKGHLDLQHQWVPSNAITPMH